VSNRTIHDVLNDSMLIIESYSRATADMLTGARSLSASERDTIRARLKATTEALDRYESAIAQAQEMAAKAVVDDILHNRMR
jgi:hypothetical protein